MVARITIMKFGVDDGGGNGTGWYGMTVRTDTAKLTKMITAGIGERYEISSEKVRCSSKMKPRYGFELENDEYARGQRSMKYMHSPDKDSSVTGFRHGVGCV